MGEGCAALIAMGPNNVEIPCMIFPDMESGISYCDNLFAKYTAKKSKHETKNIVTYFVYLEDYDSEEDKFEKDTISRTLFNQHYYGCGGPGPFVLQPVSFSKKFVNFDLD